MPEQAEGCFCFGVLQTPVKSPILDLRRIRFGFILLNSTPFNSKIMQYDARNDL